MKMTKKTIIFECIEEYKNRFSMDWIESYSWEPLKEQKSYEEAIQKITEYVESCFITFSKSIISGEYILRRHIVEELEEFSKLVENEYPPISASDLKSRLYTEYQRLDNDLLITIRRYRYFIHTITNKVSRESHDYIVNAFSVNGKRLSLSKFKDLHAYVFELFYKEHMLSYDRDIIQKLILLNESIEKEAKNQNGSIQSIYFVLKDKCSFLLKKLLYHEGIAEYSIDFQSKQIDKGDIQNEAFKDFDIYFQFVQQDSCKNYEKLVYEWEQDFNRRHSKMGQMILLMKYYKDHSNTSWKQVQILMEGFDNLYNSIYSKFQDREFDVYALHTLKNYMYNCRLSFHIKHKCSYKELCDDMNDIENIQTITHIKNFYPFKKAINFLICDIRQDIGNQKLINKEIEIKINQLKLYINKFNEAIKWCKEQHFYPFQLMYNECVKKSNGYDGAIFTPSTFSRPINYAKLADDMQYYKAEARSLQNEYNIQKERIKIEKLKTEIENTKKNYIEILGIFTAVITFLFGCVNIFSNNNASTVLNQIFHVVSLGLVLLLFVSSIYLLTMRKEEKFSHYFSHPRFFIFGLAIIGYIIILGIILSSELKSPIITDIINA